MNYCLSKNQLNFDPSKKINHMTEQIKGPIFELRKLVVDKPASYDPMPKAATKPLHQRLNLRTVVIAVIMAAILYLSAQSNYLFFSELIWAYAIVGMALLSKYLSNPLAPMAKPKSTDHRLN